MSRSYKRVPCWRDSERRGVPHRYKPKTVANRAVRRNEDVPNHGGYRRFYDSWDICYYKFFETEEQFLDTWKKGRMSPKLRDYREAKRCWRKMYKSK